MLSPVAVSKIGGLDIDLINDWLRRRLLITDLVAPVSMLKLHGRPLRNPSPTKLSLLRLTVDIENLGARGRAVNVRPFTLTFSSFPNCDTVVVFAYWVIFFLQSRYVVYSHVAGGLSIRNCSTLAVLGAAVSGIP